MGVGGGLVSARCRDGPFVDVLPKSVDPAGAGGPVSLPKEAVTMQGLRAHEVFHSREEERRRDRERDRERERAKLAAAKAPPAQVSAPHHLWLTRIFPARTPAPMLAYLMAEIVAAQSQPQDELGCQDCSAESHAEVHRIEFSMLTAPCLRLVLKPSA